jgi:hypothetical protein
MSRVPFSIDSAALLKWLPCFVPYFEAHKRVGDENALMSLSALRYVEIKLTQH